MTFRGYSGCFELCVLKGKFKVSLFKDYYPYYYPSPCRLLLVFRNRGGIHWTCDVPLRKMSLPIVTCLYFWNVTTKTKVIPVDIYVDMIVSQYDIWISLQCFFVCVSNVLQLFDGSFCHLWSRDSLPGGEFDLRLFDGFAQMGSVSRFPLIKIFIIMGYNAE